VGGTGPKPKEGQRYKKDTLKGDRVEGGKAKNLKGGSTANVEIKTLFCDLVPTQKNQIQTRLRGLFINTRTPKTKPS
jgi:hypothetical protein